MLAGAGARPLLCAGPTPTPVVNHALRARRGAAALVFTASHNPASYQGLKVLLPWGGGAPDPVARRIAAEAERWLARGEPPRGPVPAQRSEVIPAYLGALAKRLGPRPRGRRPWVVYDALHGCGAGVLDRALAARGCAVELLRGDADPQFGGGAPDPTPARLAGLARRVRARARPPPRPRHGRRRRPARGRRRRRHDPLGDRAARAARRPSRASRARDARRRDLGGDGLARRARGAPLRAHLRAAADRLQAPDRGARLGARRRGRRGESAASRGRRSRATRTPSSPAACSPTS